MRKQEDSKSNITHLEHIQYIVGCVLFYYNLCIKKEVNEMNIINIISKPELEDIPIMYILRVINAIQSDYIHSTYTPKRRDE